MTTISLKNQLTLLDDIHSMSTDKTKQFVLRQYQQDAVNAGVKHLLSKNKPGLLVEATGSGKSLIIANIAKELDGNVICFSATKEILEQNRAKLLSYNTGIDIGTYSASFNSREISKITFATIGSVYKKPELFKHFQYVLIDECDMGLDGYNSESMYRKFLDAIGNKPMLGFTATPFRLYHNSYGNVLRFLTRTSPRVWHSVVHYTQIQTLLDAGYLAECKYFKVGEFNVKNLKINSTVSDYTDLSLHAYYKKINYEFSVLDVAKRLINAGRKSILVFTKFVEEAQILADELGGIAAIVHAKMPMSVRTEILNNFKSGRIKIVCNVGILTVGFDFPDLDTVLIARPSRSLRLIYQMVGRGFRPHINKENCFIVDMADNFSRFPKIHELWLNKDNAGLWQFVDKSNNNIITNVYFQ